jgi:hypothetical protein
MDRQLWRIRRKISTETVSGGIADLAYFLFCVGKEKKPKLFACVGFFKNVLQSIGLVRSTLSSGSWRKNSSTDSESGSGFANVLEEIQREIHSG